MSTIQAIFEKYYPKLDLIDLELITAHVLRKTREFVLAHPDASLTRTQAEKCRQMLKKRLKNEPVAYILGYKEFYGLNFKVTHDTLIPRLETEQLIDIAIDNLKSADGKTTIIDIGTGSGNIIISIAEVLKKLKLSSAGHSLFATDISKKALRVARYNAKRYDLEKKIQFIHENLLEPFIQNSKLKIQNSLVIVANLPYLSKKIYDSTAPDIKNFEPKSALYSKNSGLYYYEKLFRQIKRLKKNRSMLCVMCYVEISPEQKPKLRKIIKKYLPSASIKFKKDLANKWRLALVKIS